MNKPLTLCMCIFMVYKYLIKYWTWWKSGTLYKNKKYLSFIADNLKYVQNAMVV